jgi:hypothetical protein
MLWLGAACAMALPAAQRDVVGDYIEVRSNHVYTCGCLYSGEQMTDGREAILAWSIQEGHYRGVSLAGARAVAVLAGERNLGLADTGRRSVLFVDAGDSPAQREAVAGLLKEAFGSVLGEVIGVRPAPIQFEKDGERLAIQVGEVSRLVVRPARLPEDAHQGSALWYTPFIPTTESRLGTTEYSSFRGSEFSHRWWVRDPGITAYIARFAL